MCPADDSKVEKMWHFVGMFLCILIPLSLLTLLAHFVLIPSKVTEYAMRSSGGTYGADVIIFNGADTYLEFDRNVTAKEAYEIVDSLNNMLHKKSL